MHPPSVHRPPPSMRPVFLSSVHPSIHASSFSSTHSPIHPLVHPFRLIRLPLSQPCDYASANLRNWIHLSAHSRVCSCIHPSVDQSMYFFVRPSICAFVHPRTAVHPCISKFPNHSLIRASVRPSTRASTRTRNPPVSIVYFCVNPCDHGCIRVSTHSSSIKLFIS